MLVAACMGASAQQEVGTFSIIPRIGVSIANMTNNTLYYGDDSNSNQLTVDSKSKAGLLAGFDVDYQVHPMVSVSLGAYYSMQGYRYPNVQSDDGNGNYRGFSDWTMKAQYLNFPLMLHCYVAKGFAVKAGVQVGALLSEKQEFDERTYTLGKDGNISNEQTVEHSEKSETLRKVDFSIPVGVSYEYMNVILDARYNFGLLNVNKLDIVKSRNSVFTVSVGYRFAL